MGIQVEKSDVIPQLDFNLVHMEELKITQTRPKDDPPLPVYNLMVTYRMYALDDNGKRHYSPKPHVIIIDNYLEKAMSKLHGHNDPRLIQAMGAIEHALATIMDEDGRHGSASVT